MGQLKGPGQHCKHGEGTSRQLPSGRFETSQHVRLPDGTGRRIYATGDSPKKAREVLKVKIREIQEGRAPAWAYPTTFGEYALRLIEEREGLGHRTRELYRTTLRLYLTQLHDLRLSKITPATLRGQYANLRDRDLGDVTRGHAHTLARLVLQTAKDDGLISSNPVDVRGVRPKPERGSEDEPVAFLARDEARAFLAASEKVTHGDLLAFLLLTGMRRGEARGLRWDAVDLTRRTAFVRTTRSTSAGKAYEGTPKTRQSRRDVPLSRAAVTLLHEVRARNAERREALYPDKPPSPYVFPGLSGEPHRPDNLRRTMHRIYDVMDTEQRTRVEQAGGNPSRAKRVPRLPVHGLRHTFVSLAASNPRHPKSLHEIAEIIGDPLETVMRVYLHLRREDVTAPDLDLDIRAEIEDEGL